MMAKLTDIIMDFWEDLTNKERIILGVLNVVYLLLFFFIGIPKAGILEYFIGFILVEALFLFVSYKIKTLHDTWG